MSGNIKMNFGRAERTCYKKLFVPVYGSFLQKCFCRFYHFYIFYLIDILSISAQRMPQLGFTRQQKVWPFGILGLGCSWGEFQWAAQIHLLQQAPRICPLPQSFHLIQNLTPPSLMIHRHVIFQKHHLMLTYHFMDPLWLPPHCTHVVSYPQWVCTHHPLHSHPILPYQCTL